MKRALIFCYLLFSIFHMYGQEKKIFEEENSGKDKLKVFLFAGQSNMDGRANGADLSQLDIKRLSIVKERIKFFYNNRKVTPLQLTTPAHWTQKKFDLTECFGPELFFGIEMAEKYPDQKFIFIKRSKGGTSLYGAWNSNWQKEKALHMQELKQPKLFFELESYVKEVLSNYPENSYEICGMLWVQGEDDSNIKKWGEQPAAEYGSNLKQLIEKIRESLSEPEMAFLIFQVGHGEVVNGMKAVAMSDSNVGFIPQSPRKNSPDFYPKNPPPIGHYTASGMKKIGVEFFKIYQTDYAKLFFEERNTKY